MRCRHRLPILLAALACLAALVPAAFGAELRFSRIEGTGGVPLNVVEAGERGKPAILLVHGIGQSYLSFEPQLRSALAEEFHLVAFDLRGHGASGKPWQRDAYVDSAAWAGDLQRVIAATGLQRPVLLGWSYGTLVVTDYLRHAGTGGIAGIVLTGAYGGLTPPPAANPQAAEAMRRSREAAASPDIEQRLAATRRTAGMLTAKPMPPEWVERAATIGMMVPGDARVHMFDRRFDNRDVVPRIDVPLRLVAAGKDLSTPEADARTLAAGLPLASVSVYPDAGHSPFTEDAERFNRELAEFARAAFARAAPAR
jgi:non-heme chloroperoxidase